MKASRLLAVLTMLGACVLVASIFASKAEMDLSTGLLRIVDTRWGVTTMVDLYVGLTFVAVWIGFCEKSWKRGVAWGIALALTGNLATLIYISQRAWRSNSLRDVFTPHAP